MKIREFKSIYTSMFEDSEVSPVELTEDLFKRMMKTKKICTPLPYFISNPEILELMLSRNMKNREVRQDKVMELYRCMTEGIFRFESPVSIIFNVNGEVIDGGHRISASLRYLTNNPGACVLFLIGCGYPAETAAVIDRGIKRNLRDNLKLADDIIITLRQSHTINAYFFTKYEGLKGIQVEDAKELYLKNKKSFDKVCGIIEEHSGFAKLLNVSPYVDAAFVDVLRDCSESAHKRVISFLEDCLTINVGKFPKNSPKERFVRMLMDFRVLCKTKRIVTSGKLRHNLFHATQKLILSHLNGQDLKEPMNVFGVEETSDQLRDKYKDQYTDIFDTYDILQS